MNRDTLSILADAISDVGAWQWWHISGDLVHLEFCDVQLYDESRPEKETHTTDVLAVRFRGHAFAVFLDRSGGNDWHERFRDDDSVLYPVDPYEMTFDSAEEAERVLNDYPNRIPVGDFAGAETLLSAKHLPCARCGEVGFIVGGDELIVIGSKGKYSDDDIEGASRRWWAYWAAASAWLARPIRPPRPTAMRR